MSFRGISWEEKTVNAMIRIYCRSVHRRKDLCKACTELDAYASRRILKCRFGEEKPACKDCPVHCYAPMMREKIREVMRYAGPRMIFRHPLYSVYHLMKGPLFRGRSEIPVSAGNASQVQIQRNKS